ncbi:TetR/AcrR family transcriptional regulator [Brevibacterium aurantiacum]
MRTRIQDAALTCFSRKGFAGASMADIIREADLSAGAVYVYYSSKAELTLDAAGESWNSGQPNCRISGRQTRSRLLSRSSRIC